MELILNQRETNTLAHLSNVHASVSTLFDGMELETRREGFNFFYVPEGVAYSYIEELNEETPAGQTIPLGIQGGLAEKLGDFYDSI